MKNKILISVSNGGQHIYAKKTISDFFETTEKVVLDSNSNEALTFEEKLYKKVLDYDEPIYFDNEEYAKAKSIVVDNIFTPAFMYEKLIYYYVNIDRVYGNSIGEDKKLEYAKMLMNEDCKKENGKQILYSTPMIINSDELDTGLYASGRKNSFKYDGKCLKFYNDGVTDYFFPLTKFSYEENSDGKGNIVVERFSKEEEKEVVDVLSNYYADIKKNSNVYSDYFVDSLDNYLDNVCFVYPTDDARSTIFDQYGVSVLGKKSGDVMIDVSILDREYDEQIATYTHELTHCVDCYNNIAENEEWKNIYNQIYENYKDTGLLTDYSFTDPAEFLAENISEFYANDTYSPQYNPNDLKAVTIEVNGEEITLYDYLENLLNGEYEYKYN